MFYYLFVADEDEDDDAGSSKLKLTSLGKRKTEKTSSSKDIFDIDANRSGTLRSGKRYGAADEIIPSIGEVITSHIEENEGIPNPTVAASTAYAVFTVPNGTAMFAIGQDTQEEMMALYSDRLITIEN